MVKLRRKPWWKFIMSLSQIKSIAMFFSSHVFFALFSNSNTRPSSWYDRRPERFEIHLSGNFSFPCRAPTAAPTIAATVSLSFVSLTALMIASSPSEINLTAADEQSQGYRDRIVEILNDGWVTIRCPDPYLDWKMERWVTTWILHANSPQWSWRSSYRNGLAALIVALKFRYLCNPMSISVRFYLLNVSLNGNIYYG